MFGNKCHLSVVREEHRAVENGMAQCTVQQTKGTRQASGVSHYQQHSKTFAPTVNNLAMNACVHA